MQLYFSYTGESLKLFKLYIKNFLLSLITFGFYRFWGRTHIRRYIVASFSLNDHPFVYTGTPQELLRSFLKVILFYILFAIIYATLGAFINDSILMIVFWSSLLPFVFFALYASLRYRLSRVQFQGVSFHLTAPISELVKISLVTFLKNVISFGFLTYKTLPQRYLALVNGISYGGVSFLASIDTQKIYDIHFKTWLLAPFTLGFSRTWFHTALMNEMIKNMSCGSLHFSSTFSGFDLFKLLVGNMFIVFCTFGLGMPYALQRTYRFYVAQLQVHGNLDELKTQDIADFAENTGEGLVDVLGDVGL